MKKLLLLVQIFFLIASCNTNKENKATRPNADEKTKKTEASIANCKEILIPLNGNVEQSFGFENQDEVDVVVPRAMCLYKDFVFITDPLRGMIKKVNISTKKIFSSESVFDTIGTPADICVLEDKVIATTENGKVVSFDLDLNLTESKKISKGEGSIVNSHENVEIYFPSENLSTYTLNKNLDIVTRKEGRRVDKRNKVHGKDFLVENDSVFNVNGRQLKTTAKYSTPIFGGVNVDFSQKYLCFYNINKQENNLKLVICEIPH